MQAHASSESGGSASDDDELHGDIFGDGATDSVALYTVRSYSIRVPLNNFNI